MGTPVYHEHVLTPDTACLTSHQSISSLKTSCNKSKMYVKEIGIRHVYLLRVFGMFN